jgi:hypothetical protein
VAALGGGEPTYRRVAAGIRRRTGADIDDFDLRVLPPQAQRPTLLVVHDRTDRHAALSGAQQLVEAWPEARLVVTRGLGHHRVLQDAGVVADGVAFAASELLDPARSA